MRVEIDKKSGFCFGVTRAVQMAEEHLKKNEILYCLGDIVHNSEEMERLQNMGLVSIDYEHYKKLSHCKVLIRAHGEPPETYAIAKENNIELVEASCPIVLNLQKKVRKSFHHVLDSGGQIVIYGKKGHPEINGLIGQTEGKAIVVSDLKDLDQLDYAKPIHLYSQTTKSTRGFQDIEDEIRRKLDNLHPDGKYVFFSNNTVCGQVSGRVPELRKFARKHPLIVFVSGKKSSNGKMLYQICKQENENTYFVSSEDELEDTWFKGTTSVGICGATSTPQWMMEKVAATIAAKKY